MSSNRKNYASKPLTPKEARTEQERATKSSAEYGRLRHRINEAVADPTHKPEDLITVKDFPAHVVAQVIGEFRNAGWNVSAPYAVQDGDTVITISPTPEYHGCDKS